MRGKNSHLDPAPALCVVPFQFNDQKHIKFGCKNILHPSRPTSLPSEAYWLRENPSMKGSLALGLQLEEDLVGDTCCKLSPAVLPSVRKTRSESVNQNLWAPWSDRCTEDETAGWEGGRRRPEDGPRWTR